MTVTACSIDLSAPLIFGFGVTGQAVADVLVERGHRPVVVDDKPTDAAIEAAGWSGLALTVAPDLDHLDEVVASASVLLPSPGIPDHHPVFAAADRHGVPVRSEFDLANLWDDRPVVAITGTNGKTSVVTMVTESLERSGIRASSVGNTDTPLVAMLTDPEIHTFVVEASSFRLAHSDRFSPDVATWMNFSPDHLDAHASLATYEEAKAAIWRHLGPGATVVANAEDEVVLKHVPDDSLVVTFGLHVGDWRTESGHLVGPGGPLVAVDRLPRRQPHDLANAACVAATAVAAGASEAAIVEVLEQFGGLPHRLCLIGEWNEIRWFNDSKATVPQATLAAVGGFESVVLIAGGRNKGLDLSALIDASPPVHTVVATGEAAPEVESAFAGSDAEVVVAGSMVEAVAMADDASRAGDVVLLSPACTSFDWYSNYSERGEDFMAIVNERFDS